MQTVDMLRVKGKDPISCRRLVHIRLTNLRPALRTFYTLPLQVIEFETSRKEGCERTDSIPHRRSYVLLLLFGRVDYTEALALAGLESLSDRRVGACKRFMATARQMSPLKNIIPSPAAIESHYSLRVQLPRRQHGHTRRIDDFVTYKFQSM